jgi:hypothetical protein
MIPFNGNVCPYCRCDKKEDQEIFSLIMMAPLMAFLGAIIGSCAGFCCGTGFVGTVKSFFLGIVLGGFAGFVLIGVPFLVMGLNRRAALVQRRQQEMEAAQQSTPRRRGDAW